MLGRIGRDLSRDRIYRRRRLNGDRHSVSSHRIDAAARTDTERRATVCLRAALRRVATNDRRRRTRRGIPACRRNELLTRLRQQYKHINHEDERKNSHNLSVKRLSPAKQISATAHRRPLAFFPSCPSAFSGKLRRGPFSFFPSCLSAFVANFVVLPFVPQCLRGKLLRILPFVP